MSMAESQSKCRCAIGAWSLVDESKSRWGTDMPQTYYTHKRYPDTRIKVTKKTVTWEKFKLMNVDAVIDGTEDEKREWKFYMRHPLPVSNTKDLQEMYGLPDDVVARLKGE
jgi:hypothetical protein